MVRNAVRVAAAMLLLCPMTVDAFAQTPPTSPPPPSRAPATGPSGPISPGGMRLTVRNPLPGNWICKGPACICKPLACAAQSVVAYSTKPTPARKPDPKALENFAKVEVPKGIVEANAIRSAQSDGKDKFEMVSTKVSRYHGFASVVTETKLTKEKGATFIATALIFAGPSLLTVHSMSPDRAQANKSLNEFIQAMSIEEGPSITPRARSAPNGAAPNAAPNTAPSPTPRPVPVMPRAPSRPPLQEI